MADNLTLQIRSERYDTGQGAHKATKAQSTTNAVGTVAIGKTARLRIRSERYDKGK